MAISRLGFGTWAAGGSKMLPGWGDQDDDQSLAAMRRASEADVNWIDTAAIYGLGHAEELCGRVLRDYPEPDRPLLFTKCGPVAVNTGDRVVVQSDLSPAGIMRQVDDSLRRLGVGVLDVLYVHWPPASGVPRVEEYWQVMADLRDQGKVRAIGLSNHGIEELEAAETVAHVDTVQPPFSAIHREAAAELFTWCRKQSTAVIAYSPMQSGLLSGRFTEARAAALPPADWRSRDSDFTAPALQRNLQVADAMMAVARRHDASPSAVAVAWVLAWSDVTGAIVGARSHTQVDEWIGAPAISLSREDMTLISSVITTSGAGSGPAEPT
jgi:aryl-alcohol dehydrogenase-like predicted oxidoreductase